PTFTGYNVNWDQHIKPYAEEVISVIRQHDAQVPIIVGTGSWSQDVHHAAANPLQGNDIMYAIHFYACDHGSWLRDRARDAVNSGLALFSTEWGTTEASGNGSVCTTETNAWLDFFADNNISWANWNVSDKDETSALFVGGTPSTPPDGGEWADFRLTESGRYVRDRLRSGR
ncbi:MAG: endoglucanase, partial [Alteromonadaceae bacterium]